MPKSVSDEYVAQVTAADEYEEVGGDFPPIHDFEEAPELVGRYLGSRVVNTKKGDRVIHTFDVNGQEVEAWGAAILNDRLADLEGKDVKVVRPGDKVPTKSGGSAWVFQVFVRKGALATGEDS